jgi:hypothetical protein
VFFFSLEEGKREKAKQKRKGLGLQEASPTVHTLILKKKRKTDTRKNPSVPLFTSLRLFASEVRVLTSISTLDFSTLFCLLFVVKVKEIISSSFSS